MKPYITLLLVSLVLSACTVGNISSTGTTLPVEISARSTGSPSPTFSKTPDSSLTPTVTPTPEPTITPSALRENPIVLPRDLEIEEYLISSEDVWLISPWSIEKLVGARHPDHDRPDHISIPSLMDEFSLTVNGEELTVMQSVVTFGNSPGYHAIILIKRVDYIYSIVDCGSPSPIGPIITAWGFDDNLIFQTLHDMTFDILWNGEFLNASKGYQSSLGFQILGGKPFYFFKRDDKMWLYYDGEEVLLPYDQIETQYCCEGYPIPSPRHYNNMIAYYAKENDQSIFGVIGFLTDPD